MNVIVVTNILEFLIACKLVLRNVKPSLAAISLIMDKEKRMGIVTRRIQTIFAKATCK
jgi:hypothetical protein